MNSAQNRLIATVLTSCLWLWAGAAKADTTTLRCDDLPGISLEGNRYYSTGKGNTLREAIEQAQQQLSQMLNTRISSACTDKDKAGKFQGTQQNTAESDQFCSLKSYSSNRFTQTPVISVKHCDREVLVVIEFDQRPLVERMQATFPELSPLLNKDESDRVAFPTLITLLRKGELTLLFDEQHRLWRFQTEYAHLFVSQNELWHGLHWQGCHGDATFRMENWGEAIDTMQEGEAAELIVQASKPFLKASLYEANEYGGIEALAENVRLNHHQLIGKRMPGDFASSYVYLLVVSDKQNKRVLQDATLNPGKAFSVWLDDVISQDEAHVCAWPMKIIQAR
jgi:hypothetical protein